jgi:hypothetical protein
MRFSFPKSQQNFAPNSTSLSRTYAAYYKPQQGKIKAVQSSNFSLRLRTSKQKVEL